MDFVCCRLWFRLCVVVGFRVVVDFDLCFCVVVGFGLGFRVVVGFAFDFRVVVDFCVVQRPEIQQGALTVVFFYLRGLPGYSLRHE